MCVMPAEVSQLVLMLCCDLVIANFVSPSNFTAECTSGDYYILKLLLCIKFLNIMKKDKLVSLEMDW